MALGLIGNIYIIALQLVAAGRLFSYSTFYTVLNQETLIRVE